MTRLQKVPLAVALVLTFVAGCVFIAVDSLRHGPRLQVVAYFDNSNGIYVGDDVRILGVRVGKIERIEPQAEQVEVAFWVDAQYKIPSDVMAAVLSPTLVTARSIQLTPAYTGGPTLTNNSVIPLNRTAVPVEFDDVRKQLQKLTETLQPTEAGGVSTLGAFVNTAADNLRGRGAEIREAIIKMSKAFSALGDHSTDIFSTVRNLSTLVSALQSSTELMTQLNQNFASVTSLLADDHDEIGRAVRDLSTAAGDVQAFVSAQSDSIGTTSDKLAAISTALTESLGDIKQTLHMAPNSIANFNAIFEPANGGITGAIALANFSNPLQFICGAIQAASRLDAEQSAKLCVQYLAPIVKNRQYNFPPFGMNPFVGAKARPNEISYSEQRLRPTSGPNALPPSPYPILPPPPTSPPPPAAVESPLPPAPLAAEAVSTDPAAGLPGIMVPTGS